jgi:hypothetical protein
VEHDADNVQGTTAGPAQLGLSTAEAVSIASSPARTRGPARRTQGLARRAQCRRDGGAVSRFGVDLLAKGIPSLTT